jgi:hypothetical protein
MPLLLPTTELQPGHRLYEPIIENGRIMVPAGRRLSRDEIDSLLRRDPDRTLLIDDPALDGLAAFEDDSHERAVAATVRRKIALAMGNVQHRLVRRTGGQNIGFRALKRAVREMMSYLTDNPVSAALVDGEPDGEHYLCDHIGSVFYLSMVLASAVRDYIAGERRKQTAARELSPRIAYGLRPLGQGVVFMDLGMFPLQALFTKEEPLTDEECQQVLEHPLVALDMLPEHTDPTTRMIVRTHHENYDGSGYPIGIGPDRLHVFTRIVRIADSYDAAISRRVYKEAKSPARALWEMSVGPYRRFYDPVLMGVFARLVQPFPVGARLRLDDGRWAVLVRYNRRNPFSPTVLIAFDAEGRRLPKEQVEGPIRLDRRPDLRLASYAGEDLSFIYEPEPDLDGVPIRQTFQSLYESVVP